MNTRIQCLGHEHKLGSCIFRTFKLKAIFLIALSLNSITTSFAQVGISSTSITPDASSILELRSTTAGFLPPRMTTIQRDAIASPATGLLIYNTSTDLLNYYTGSSWQVISGGGVSSVSVTTANGVSGSVANATTTPAISLTLGAITPSSVAATGTVTGSNLSGTNTGDQTITLTGDVTGSGTGSFATTIAANAVTNTELAQMAANTIKGNNTAGTANPADLTVTQLKSMLGIFTKAVGVDVTNSTTTPAKITDLDETLGPGTYTFKYYIRYQAAALTTGVKFSVNHSGTVTAFVANVSWVDVSATAATAAPDQNQVIATGAIVGAFAARAKSTAGWGTTLSVDAINSDMLMIIEGLVVVSVSGDLQLYHGSEVAAPSTVKTGSSVIITKVN